MSRLALNILFYTVITPLILVVLGGMLLWDWIRGEL